MLERGLDCEYQGGVEEEEEEEEHVHMKGERQDKR